MTQASTVHPIAAPDLPVAPDNGYEPANGASANVLYEIVNGQRVEKPPMSTYSTRIAFILAKHVDNFAEAQKKGQAGVEYIFRLDEATNLQRRPDVGYVSFQRWPQDRPLPHTDPWPVVPELAVEVVSPTNPAEGVVEKIAEYFQAGVQLVWVVFPRRRQVYVYESPTRIRVLTETDELDGGTVLAGFRLPLATLFSTVATPP